MKQKRDRKLAHQLKKEHIINFKIDTGFKNDFKNHCVKNGYSIAKRIRALMKADIENKVKIY